MKLSSSFFHVRLGSLAAALAGLLATHTAQASLTWDGNGSQGGSGTWDANITANWWNDTANVVWPNAGGTNNDAVFAGTAGNVTVTNVTANDLTFNTTGYTLTSGTLTLNGSSPTITTGNGISAAISSSIAGSSGLIKAGLGTLTLSGVNSYSGVTAISGGGVLSISQDDNLGVVPLAATAGSLVLDDSSTLATTESFTLNSNRGIKIGPASGIGAGIIHVATGTTLSYGGIITSNGVSGTGGLVKEGAGILFVSGANAFTGATTINAGTLKMGSANALPSGAGKGNVVVNATLDLNGQSVSVNGLSGTGGIITSGVAGAITFTAGANHQSGVYNGTIENGSGLIAFTKTGTGAITLGGNNSFTGGVTINNGALRLGHAGALNSASPNSVVFGANATVGTKLQLGGNSVTISSLATNALPGSVILENADANAATLTVNQSSNTTFAGVLQNGTGGGALNFVKAGAGVLTLSGANTHTGTTTISGGTLALSGGTALSDTNAVVLNNTSGATMLLNANETIGSLSGGGANGGNVSLQGFTLTTGGANTDTSYGGVISGTGSLIKSGTGVFTLSRGNAYTGNTLIKNGQVTLGIDNALTTATVLTLGDGTTHSSGVFKLNGFNQTVAGLNTAGSGTSNRIINGSATTKTLTLNNANNYAFSGILGGSNADEDNFNLVKSGAGVMTLSGNNTYTGTTTINAGTLSVGNIGNGLGSGASAIALSGGTLSYTGNNASFTRGFSISASGGQVDITTAGQLLTLATGPITITGTGNFTVGGAGNTAITSNITGAGGGILTKTGIGTLTLSGNNTYTGATNIKNGSVILGVDDTGLNASTFLTLGDAVANSNGILKLDGHTQTLAGLTIIGSGTGNRVVGGNAGLSTLTLNHAGAMTFAGILGGSGGNENNLALVKSGIGTLTLSGSNTYAGGTTISAGTLAVSSAGNLGAAAGQLSIGAGALQVTNHIAASSRGFLLTNASSSISIDAGMSYTHSGAITGAGALNLTGTGNLIVSGTSNDYSGGTFVKNGTLTLGTLNALPTATIVTLGNGTNSGKLALNGFGQTLTGLTTSGTGTVNRVVNGKSTAAILTINNSSDTAFSGILGGTTANENNFSLTKSGTGKLTLSGINTYTGNTVISAGTLALGSTNISIPTGVGVGNVQVDGTLDVNGRSPTINGLSGSGIILNNGATGQTISVGNNNVTSTYAGVIQDGTGTVALIKVGSGTLTLSGTNTYSGNTTVTLGTLKIGSPTAIPSATGKGNVSLTGALDLNGNSITINGLTGAGGISSSVAGAMTLSVGANDQTSSYTGVISNGTATSLGLTKVGTGILTISGASTYSGDTTISAGTLKLNGTAAISSGNGKGNLSITSGAFLDMNNRSQTINGLAGAGTVTNSVATAVALTVGSNNQTSTFDGTLQNGAGTLTLAKTGTGILTLAGNNTFTGGITISGGVIQAGNVNAFNSAGTNVVTFGSSVAVGTKLQLNGNSVTIAGLATGTTVGSPIVENANSSAATLTINNTNANTFTYAGVIQDGAGGGAFSLVKNGIGTQILSGTNTYTGSTSVRGGILSISADANLGVAPASATAGSLAIEGGTLRFTNSSDITLSANRGIALGVSSGTSSGTVEIVSTAGAIRTVTYAGAIANNGAGTGQLIKSGLGNLALSGTSSFTGGILINAGLVSVTSTGTGALGADVAANKVEVSAGGNLSLSSISNKGSNQTITVNSNSSALGGIGFSNAGLTQAALTGMFTDSTGSFGGVLGINSAISYNSAINLATFGSGGGQGYWFLGSSSSGTFSGAAANLTVGAGNVYRLGGGGGSLTMSQSNVLTGANSVQIGSGSTNGNGTVNISTAQNYTGNTTVTGGAVLSISTDAALGAVPGSATPDNLVLNNGTLQARSGLSSINANRGIAVGPTSGSGGGTIDTNSINVSYSGIIANNGSGSGSFTKIGSGTLTLTGNRNTFSGDANIYGGTVNFSGINDLGIGAVINFGQGINGGTLQYASGNAADITTRTVTTAGGGAIIDTNGNDVIFGNSAISGIGSFTKSGAGTLTLNVANTYTGATTISAGTVKLGNVAALPSTTAASTTTVTGTLDLNGLSPTVNLLRGAGTITNSNASAATISVNTGGSSTAGTFSGAINDGTGTVAFIKTGANTLNLTGTASTYSGGTTISAGALSISNERALGVVPSSTRADNIVITGGATLGTSATMTLDSKYGIVIGPSGATAAILAPATGTTLNYNGNIANSGTATGGLTKSNTTGILVLGGANTYAGDTTISGGTLRVANASAIPFGVGKGNVSIASTNSGNLDLNGRTITINGLTGAGGITSSVVGPAGITVGDNNQTSSYSGAISNGSGVVSLGKTGTGTLTLSGTSSNYTGGTTISDGTLSISSDSNLGATPGSATPGNVILNGGKLNTSVTMTLNSNRGIAVGPASGNGTGTLDPSAGTTLTYGGIIANNGSGTGGLTKTNTTGTLVLSGANTYSGDTTISGGTLQLGNVAAIPSGSGKGNLALASGSTLDLNNLSPTVNGLSGLGTVTNSATGSATFSVGGNDASSLFAGAIQDGNGTVSLTKTGNGKLTLSGTNTYSGDTTISSGILEISVATALPSGLGKGNVILNGTLDIDSNLTINGLSGSGTISTDTTSGVILTAGANDQTSTFAGNITNGTGTVGLTKIGTGKLTLSGNNNYSGLTTISTGTLAMGSATGLSSASTLTISGPGFLDINGFNVAMDGLLGTGTITNNGSSNAILTAGAAGGSTTFGGVIADGSKAISLTKSGAGTLTLTGINTYSGATTITNGTISVANIGIGGNLGTATIPIILGDGSNKGTLSYTGNSDLTYTRGFTVNEGGGEINTTAVGKTLTLQSAGITTAGTFTVSGAGNAIVQSVISGIGGLTKANIGSMMLSSVNTYSGDTTISTGTLQVTNAAAIPSGTGKGNVAVNGTSVLDMNNLSITLNGLSGSGIITNSQGSPVTLTLGGNNSGGDFTGVIEDGMGTTSLVKTGWGTQTLSGTNTYSGNTTISAGTLRFGNATALPSGAAKGMLTVSSTGILDLNDFEVTLNQISGTGLITNDQGVSTLSIGNNQSGTFEGSIRDGNGTIGLTKIGTGILTLSGNNTFSGDTLISQGTLSMGSDTGLSARSTLTIGNAGALDLNGRTIVIDGLAGTGSITNNSTTQVMLTIGASGGAGTYGGTINDGAGVIGLMKSGSGMVTLSNVNSYSGGTTVNGGLLAITSDNALGAVPSTPAPSNIVLDGGGIHATDTFEIHSNRGIAVGPSSGTGSGILSAEENQTLTYNGIIANNESGSGSLTKSGLGTVVLGGANTYTGDTIVSEGALQIGNAQAVPSGIGKGNLQLNATLDINDNSILINGLSGTGLVTNSKTGFATLTAGGNNQTSTFGGVIENGGGITAFAKTGTGVLTFTGKNTYSGGTTISAGTLAVSADFNLGNAPGTATPANIVINAGATLAATSTFTLASNRGIAVGPSGAGIIDVASSKTLTYGGAIANNGGSGGFTKTGTGTLILTGNSTYTGTTTVESGVMTVNGNIGGSEATVVKTGATLNGKGTTGAMDVLSDGTLQPGDGGIGTLTVSGRLSLAGIANFELGTPGASHESPGTSDRVIVNGDVNYGGTINLIDNNNAGGLGSAGAGSYKLITYTGTSSGNFTGVTGLPKYHNAFHDVPADNALYIDLYDYAVATVTQDVNLGRIHAGGTFGTQALTVSNSAASSSYTESLGGVIGSTSAGITASGSVTGIAGQSNNSSNIIVGISDNTAGLKTGSVGMNFTSQAVSGSGLGNTALDPQNVAVTGFAYTGQSVWNASGGGSWGNNTDDFSRWDEAGGTPGLDGALSVNDTATFGDKITADSTVSLDGANPTLSGIRFDHDQSYTLAQGTGGSLTLKGNGAPAPVANDNGSHTISTSLGLASNANVSVAKSNDTLTISGTISGLGNGITKSGDGTLALTGHSGYTGATVVSAGTLLVNGSLGNTSVTIASGATLAGNGTLGGSVMVNGNIAPGEVNDIGTIGVGSLFVDHLMSIDWNGNTDTVDRVNITNALQLGELSTIVFTGIDGTLTREAYVFAAYGTFTGPVTRFGTVIDMPSGYTIDYAYGAGRNQLALVVVPEQGSVLLGGLGVLILLRRRRADQCSSK